MAETISDLVAVREISPDVYESSRTPEQMGNLDEIAYGGCSLAIGINAAFSTIHSKYTLYTAQGNFLGPASIHRKLRCRVDRIRDTKTFATRSVKVSQAQDNGSERLVLVLLADFQVPERRSLLEYSRPPAKSYTSPATACPTLEARREEMVRKGEITPKMAKTHSVVFGLGARHFEMRPCPEGIFAQNLTGMSKGAVTTQDGLHVTEKTSADWVRCRHDLESAAGRASALAFLMDGAIAFMPLSHSHLFLEDSRACSSLDFSLRLFVNDADITKWHLREMRAINGGVGRTYSEAQLWDEGGRMVANMTQQSILRPKI